MRRLLLDKNINLGPRIVDRLRLSDYRDPSEAVTGAISCLGAIWHIFAYCWHSDNLQNDVEEWFDEETLPILETFTYEGPIIGHVLSSTIALFASSLLDSYFSTAKSMEQELHRLGVELPWAAPGPRMEQLRVQRYLFSGQPDVGSGCIMAFKKWLSLLQQEFKLISTELNNQPSHPPSTDELLHALWSFQTLVNEARTTIYMDFLTKSLSDFPPYESLSTFYLLVSDHDISLPVSLHNQTRLIDFLKEHEDIPQVVVDQLLNFVPILSDEGLLGEAEEIITDYFELAIFPENSSASNVLALLHEQRLVPRPSILDLFQCNR